MAKKNNKKGIRIKKRTARPRVARPMSGALDSYAADYARLIMDPCNARLVAPTFQGSGSGQYVRVRKFITTADMGGSANGGGDVVFTWVPGELKYFGGQGAGGASFSVGTAAPMFQSDLTAYKEARCIAACVRVNYTGVEVNRCGVLGLSSGGLLYGTGTTVNVQSLLSNVPVTQRLGETVHEVKWVPSFIDQDLKQWDSGTGISAVSGNALTIIAKGATVTTQSGVTHGRAELLFELTAVYEVSGSSGGNAVSSLITPPSRNTLNDVLRALGPTINWAYTNIAVPVLKAGYTAGAAALRSGVNAAFAGSLPALVAL